LISLLYALTGFHIERIEPTAGDDATADAGPATPPPLKPETQGGSA
jgi:hypothetical protein